MLMGRQKGTSKTGGRKIGTPNKSTVAHVEKVQEFCDQYKLDPIQALFKIASDETNDLNLRVSILKEIAQYLYPKKKSIEIAADIEINSSPQIQIFLPDNGTNRN